MSDLDNIRRHLRDSLTEENIRQALAQFDARLKNATPEEMARYAQDRALGRGWSNDRTVSASRLINATDDGKHIQDHGCSIRSEIGGTRLSITTDSSMNMHDTFSGPTLASISYTAANGERRNDVLEKLGLNTLTSIGRQNGPIQGRPNEELEIIHGLNDAVHKVNLICRGIS